MTRVLRRRLRTTSCCLRSSEQCSTHLHSCAGRVSGLLDHVRDKVIQPPSHDPRNVVDLLEKCGDAHISDSGWREVDTEEWFSVD